MRLTKLAQYSMVATKLNSINWSDNGRYLHYSFRYCGEIYDVCKHVLVYFVNTGELPEVVDHEDGNTYNNEFSNLRAATQLQNSHNRKINSNNTTGVKGVSMKYDKYVARLRVGDGKRTTVGTFNSLEEADRALRVARDKHHGAFAKHG